MNSRHLKQLKYFTNGLLIGEYPKIHLNSVITLTPTKFDELAANNNGRNCFITWKSPRLTKTHALSYQTFIDDNRDYNFVFFDDETMFLWMQELCHDKELLRIFNHLEFSASKADIFRLAILYSYGGVHASINRVFTSPITSVIKSTHEFAITFERYRYVRSTASTKIPIEFRQNSIVQHTIASPIKHKILEFAMEEIKRNAHEYMGKKFPSAKEAIWKFTASLMLTRAVDTFLNADIRDKKYIFLGFEFNDSVKIPEGSNYRYASSPSYLGARNKVILKPF